MRDDEYRKGVFPWVAVALATAVMAIAPLLASSRAAHDAATPVPKVRAL